MRILKIGITGSAGSGKSLVLNAFKTLGLATLDCDRIARQVVKKGQNAHRLIAEAFGPGVLKKDGSLNRAALRERIISEPEMRKILENITHPEIIREMERQMAEAFYEKEPACAVEVPLLFEIGMEDRFDAVLTVVSDGEALKTRVAQRDGVSRESAGKLLSLQMSQEEKAKRSDYVVENRGTPQELVESVEKIYHKIKKDVLTRKNK